MTSFPDWIAVDWGTSHVRVWLMTRDGQVLDRRDSDKGMGKLTRDQFAPTLAELLSDVPDASSCPVIICGMAGAQQGWVEAPYVATPCAPPGAEIATRVPETDWDVRILPGVKQMHPADVMRGEETQIAGLLLEDQNFEGTLCLPGTHNKWVRIKAGQVTEFRTFMTGEIFALISTQSVLRHSVNTTDHDQKAFEAALESAMADPSSIAANLFSLRAEGLLHGLPTDTARARLSALLIGAELAATRPFWQAEEVLILGEGDVARAYEAALAKAGGTARCVDAETLTLAGLKSAYAKLGKAAS
ncbi:2-dehydro-3-deoxygalactonokinase [Aliiroseovarius sp. KMU-50]|uniref:2-dehydro-3-deoxygalactonokinase n=1 Tax=Aliiroseovarius salicola TaxID=3009082 RepID=A0ABT4W2L2_9RHOB|nr:2-dehydro-3-deoxygalactonokinase [Aliiroseovarius sp. KMU-50]MDA5094749.1 2-dehydro-3-deoxygalactonokinase [Aliiroseovarius sp. KMU-50]